MIFLLNKNINKMKVIDNIRDFFGDLRRWFSYWKAVRKMHDFDYSSILIAQRHQIERVRNSIIHFQNHVNWRQDVASMNLALTLLDIIEENGASKILPEGKEHLIFNGDSIDFSPDTYWKLDIYVNTRNASRFSKIKASFYDDKKSGDLYKDDLRVAKAWHLYHKLLEYKMRSWWD